MSFLLEDDPQATLLDALAFIDACEDSDDGTSGVSSSGDDDGHAGASLSPPPLLFSSAHTHSDTSLRVVIRNPTSLDDFANWMKSKPQTQTWLEAQQPPLEKPAATRKLRRANAVKKHRENKKYEMQALREQVVQLQSRLARLQRSARAREIDVSSVHISSADSHHSEQRLEARAFTWLDFAALRERERLESEALNAKLRDALRSQLLANKAFEGVLNRKKVEGLELLLNKHKIQLRQQCDDRLVPTTCQFESAALKQLQAELHQMYLSTDSVFKSDPYDTSETQRPGSGSLSSIHVNETSDSVAGLCTEVRSSSMVHCSFREAGEVAWQGMYPHHAAIGSCKLVKRALTATSFQKSFNIVLDGYEKHPVGLSGAACTHKFDEDERLMLMWTSKITISSNGPALIERGWIVASELPTPSGVENSGGPLAVVRMYCQAVCPSPPQDPENLEKVAFVLKWLGRKTRDFDLRMQDALADKFPSFQPPQVPVVVS